MARSSDKDKKHNRKRGGGNPNVPEGAYGGADDDTASLQEQQQYGGQMFPPAMWEYLKSLPPPETLSEYATTKARLKDPVAFARHAQEARLADPFGPGGYFEGRGAASMTPEAILASQGNNAMNQWGQLGGVKGVDPATLAALNQATGGPRTGSVGLPISPEEMAEFERQAALNTPKTYI